MEFYSPLYELLYTCEKQGMHLPKGWDLMTPESTFYFIQTWLGDKHGN